MDKNVFEVPKNPTMVAAECGIILKTQAPTLLNKSSMLKGAAALAALSEACWRPVTITNPMVEAPLTFSVTTDGPFVIKPTGALGGIGLPERSKSALVSGVKSIANIASNRANLVSIASPQQPPARSRSASTVQGGGSKTSQSTTHFPPSSSSSSSSGGSNTLGRIFNLLPQQSAAFSIAFLPKRDFRQTLKQTLVANIEDKPSDKLTEAEGTLLVMPHLIITPLNKISHNAF